MAALYNEIDPKAAAWLRELIKQGLIADGEVDERSIVDLRPSDLRGFNQVHFFAGIGGWSYALRLAGWPDDREVWTGSPPCQPFSAAGKQLGQDDERHLAPHFIELVAACRPSVLYGEQVASAAVFGKAAGGARKRVAGMPEWAWLDDLCDRLEAARYAVGASDLPSSGIGAPHIRQRTFFGAVDLDGLADAQCGEWREVGLCGLRKADGAEGSWPAAEPAGNRDGGGLAQPHGGQRHGLADGEGCERDGPSPGWQQGHGEPAAGQQSGGLADADDAGLEGRPGVPERSGERIAWARGVESRLEHAASDRRQQWRPEPGRGSVERGRGADLMDDGERPGPLHGVWRDADWLFCRDGQWRPVEPGSFPLAHGIPARMASLRGYGNAINPWLAAAFINAFEVARGLMRCR